MQSAFFFLYNGTVCLAFFLMLGTVGWRSSLSFVRHIYRCRRLPETSSFLSCAGCLWAMTLEEPCNIATAGAADSLISAFIHARCTQRAVPLTCLAFHCSAIKSD